MNGHEADPLVDAINHLPRDCAATLDLREASALDQDAAQELGEVVTRRRLDGIEFSIVVSSAEHVSTLADAGVSASLALAS